MNIQEYNELQELQNKIRVNSATLNDYKRYEQVLKENGIYNDVDVALKQRGLNSLGEYYYSRIKAKTFEQKLMYNGELLGWILGIGGALLLLWTIKESNKSSQKDIRIKS